MGMQAEAAMSEEKATRSMVDVVRLAEELRNEQDCAMALERDKKLLEAQVKDASNRLDEAEQNALKGGKKAIAKMETRIRELQYGQDEDRKNHENMQGLIDNLQQKIKTYKKQIEEAEEIASLNLAKFRQVQASLGASIERADLNEQALAKSRARARSMSVGPM